MTRDETNRFKTRFNTAGIYDFAVLQRKVEIASDENGFPFESGLRSSTIIGTPLGVAAFAMPSGSQPQPHLSPDWINRARPNLVNSLMKPSTFPADPFSF
jgi:hypothetical protein